MVSKLRKQAFIELEKEEYEKAKLIYTNLIDSNLTKVEDFINISHIYIHLNEHDKALKYLLKAIKVGFVNSEIYYNIGKVFLNSPVYKLLPLNFHAKTFEKKL